MYKLENSIYFSGMCINLNPAGFYHSSNSSKYSVHLRHM